MNRALRTLCLVVSAISATAQTPSAPAITQLFGFPCDSTLTQCPDGSFPQGFIESADGDFYGITVAAAPDSIRKEAFSRSRRPASSLYFTALPSCLTAACQTEPPQLALSKALTGISTASP